MVKSRHEVVSTENSPYAKLVGVSIANVEMYGFLGNYLRKAATSTLPRIYELLEETSRLDNFRIAAGKKEGTFYGHRFNDTDVYKWIEAVSYLLCSQEEKKLEESVELAIEEIKAAQDEDGYLDTYYPPEKRNERWTDLAWSHEMYCAGHLFQAAVAHKRVTDKENLFEVACRFADHIVDNFGPGKRPELDGHPEIEMALVELYRETRDKKYLELAEYFVLARGKGYASDTKKYGGITPEYFVDHKPFIELESPVGHAVRMLYLCCGATDVYLETGNEDIKKALERIWKSLVSKKMYITGGAGSRHEGESFGADYELPNKRAYAETCAAIANFMWNYRMLLATADARYVDVMEQTLYNGLLSGISLDGVHYFYDNPLESDGSHRRREWFECACCPPNIARLITSLPGYLYSTSKDDTALWINLYEDSKVDWKTAHGNMVLNLKSNYPWDSTISIEVAESDVSVPASIFIRIPGWVRDFSVKINGDNVNDEPVKGYIELKKVWKAGDLVDVVFAMRPELVLCHPFSEENRGRAAVKRGPMVYCAEGVDNREFDVRTLVLNYDSEIKEQMEEIESLGRLVALSGKGLAQVLSDWGENLYIPANGHISRRKPVEYKLIPYFAWANREASPMVVWMDFA